MIAGNSIDMIFADPPYFLSNGGITCKAGKMVRVDKAEWDKSNGFKDNFDFTLKWLSGCREVLKDGGTIWISGTPHNIYYIGFALQTLGFKILNEISWFKPNAPPNLSCRYFAHSHETVLWARKNGRHKFNYQKMKDWNSDKINPKGKQMKSVWSIPLTPLREKVHGKHPTQKPIELLKRIIESSTDEGDLVLDPFNGSGTTGVVAKMLRRKYIGIDTEKEYLELTRKRLFNLS
ncbi:MAG: site-specific DNA-methyltransferase [Candidatus Aenigmarchaeota archaeon]|nr:site-specific DNA-methyltransferase [Candidatus Aenigmarchaeota archaeon]